MGRSKRANKKRVRKHSSKKRSGVSGASGIATSSTVIGGDKKLALAASAPAGRKNYVAAEKEKDRENIFTRIGKFVSDVRREISNVVWPKRNETLIATIMVIIFVFIAAIFFLLADQLFLYVMRSIIENLGRVLR